MANAGAYRPIEIAARSGTLVNCRAPAPVANRMATGHRVVTTVLGAFAAARPDMVPAAYYGVSYVSALSVPDKATGGRSIYFEIEVGGWGAHPDEDGASGFSAGFHNLANSPIEMNEAFFPITFTEYALIADSGGAGRTRGGLGLRREWRLDAAEGTISASFDRFRVPPYGLRGGAPGRAGRFYLKRAGETRQLAAKTANLALRRGDRVGLETSGGGGNDDPKKRARTAVELDIEGGYITDKTAQKTYAYKS
jgi:N-methylhydantoinase B